MEFAKQRMRSDAGRTFGAPKLFDDQADLFDGRMAGFAERARHRLSLS
ncbi:MAG: hypothetical protein FD138_2522, partial [Planctomycetota bacterium]